MDRFRRVRIGRRQRRRDARAEAEAQPRSHYQPVPLTGLFSRKKKYQLKLILLQLYIPSALFVLAAYITLFMPPNGLVARSGVPVRLHCHILLGVILDPQGDGLVRPLLHEQRHKGQRPQGQLRHHGRRLV